MSDSVTFNGQMLSKLNVQPGDVLVLEWSAGEPSEEQWQPVDGADAMPYRKLLPDEPKLPRGGFF